MKSLSKITALICTALVTLAGCAMTPAEVYGGLPESTGFGKGCAQVKSSVADGAGLSGGSAVGEVNTDRFKEMIWDGMLARGFSAKEAAAAFANIQFESGFDATKAEIGRGQYWLHPGYNSYGEMSGAYIGWGLVQWTYGRHDAVRQHVENSIGSQYYVSQYSAKEALDAVRNNPEQVQKLINSQLDFLVKEFQGPYKNVMSAMASAGTVEEASKVWTIRYEVPADSYGQANSRAPLARRYYDQYSSRGQANDSAREQLLNGISISQDANGGAGFGTSDQKKSKCSGDSYDASGNVTAQVDAELRGGGLYGKVCYHVCVGINGKEITMPHGVDDSGWSGNKAAALEGATLSFPTEQRAFVAALAVSRTNMPYSFGGGHAISLDDKGFNQPTGGGLAVDGYAQCGPVNGGYDCSGLAGSAWYEAGGTSLGNGGWLPTAAAMKNVPGANVRSVAERQPGDAVTSQVHVAIYLGSYGGQEWLFHAQNCSTRISWTPYYDGFQHAVSYDTNNGKVKAVGKQS